MEHHGKSNTPEYYSWMCARMRCENPNDKRYARYGGRGIEMCERWRRSFSNFLADMGPKPSPQHTLNRKDNDGNYEPSNCCWATEIEQHSNRADNRLISHNGVKLTIAEWARQTGIKDSAIRYRLGSGWSVEQALTAPVRIHDPQGPRSRHRKSH